MKYSLHLWCSHNQDYSKLPSNNDHVCQSASRSKCGRVNTKCNCIQIQQTFVFNLYSKFLKIFDSLETTDSLYPYVHVQQFITEQFPAYSIIKTWPCHYFYASQFVNKINLIISAHSEDCQWTYHLRCHVLFQERLAQLTIPVIRDVTSVHDLAKEIT